ncbi:uncharacterized protein [Argopecten irradians]|uniref:uncharacterized protein n=1 Tax=Argopecten irradians TaxID=31199 RepID=UPI0037182043
MNESGFSEPCAVPEVNKSGFSEPCAVPEVKESEFPEPCACERVQTGQQSAIELVCITKPSEDLPEILQVIRKCFGKDDYVIQRKNSLLVSDYSSIENYEKNQVDQ